MAPGFSLLLLACSSGLPTTHSSRICAHSRSRHTYACPLGIGQSEAYQFWEDNHVPSSPKAQLGMGLASATPPDRHGSGAGFGGRLAQETWHPSPPSTIHESVYSVPCKCLFDLSLLSS